MTSTTQHTRLDAACLRAKHEAGLDYAGYLATDPGKAARWNEIYEQVSLDDGVQLTAVR